MKAQNRLGDPIQDDDAIAAAPTALPDLASMTDAVATASPARLLQARLKAAYSPQTDRFVLDTELPPLVRLAILLGSACGLWVCLGGLAFLILR